MLLLALPFFAPWLASAWKARYAFFFDTPLLLLTILSCGLASRARQAPRERRFWALLAFAFCSWLSVRLFEALVPQLRGAVEGHLVRDLLYLGYYLFFVLALELRPHESAGDPRQRLIRQTEATAAITCSFALLVYLSIIPSALAPTSFLSFVPSNILYVLLDAYLLVRAVALQSNALSPGWRRLYGNLVLTAGLFLALDGIDLMTRIEGVPGIRPGSPLEVLWLVPNVTMIVTARLGAWRAAGTVTGIGSGRDPFTWLWRGRLVYYALALPLVHLMAEVVGLIEEESRLVRQVWVLVSSLVLMALAILYDRRLAAQHRALEEDHDRMAEQLEISKRMDAVRRLAGGVAHDFNNMLTVIRGHADLLRAELEPGGRGQEDAEQISLAAVRASGLTERLLAMSRRPRGGQGSFCPSEVVAADQAMLERLVGEDLELRLELTSSHRFVRGEAAAFTDALVNLIMNARDATPAGGWIAIRTGDLELHGRQASALGVASGSYGTIEVADSGRGLDEETRRHVFEPFFTTRKGGTGLGLSMVYSFATEARGTVEVQSRLGVGTTFRIVLPEAAPTEPIQMPKGVHRLRGSGTVLVVEDEEGVRLMVARTLVAAGYSVIEAENGRQALDKLEAGAAADLVLTDVVMPEMGGAPLAEQMHEKAPELPFVFMTGYADDKLDDLGRWSKKFPVLSKPFTGEQLVHLVQDSLQAAVSEE